LKLGVWTTCSINFNWGEIHPHKDQGDYKHGFCFAIPYGEFTGGALYFPDLKITINMKPGMVVAFKSEELLHEVLKYEGQWYSVILFTSQNCFFNGK
jgi:hypothetical protein